ncbi:MarR family winged helix-turn-helix transcriptional regulator [Jeotgalibaca ciconiae]|uniref:HTH-type transcriptional regulator SarZ n=1 Tax=Jeotgalibaca ciconiae TaxID=2496265 RepID=A0A3Q9BKQ4_9LACT|nr:MarR family transcriptional regulator [Jeotgalibaca ciconiae]AZP03500.1 MarR family transcriptional regulator [Jeotgalibaca ciconiae]
MKGNQFKLDQQLCFSAYNLSKQFTKFYRPVLDPYSLSYPQYIALLALWEKDHISIQELGNKLGLDSGTLTPMLKRMESAGYITRVRNPEDERKVMINLTNHANEIKDELLRKVSSCLDLLNFDETGYFSLLEKLSEINETIGGINND